MLVEMTVILFLFYSALFLARAVSRLQAAGNIRNLWFSPARTMKRPREVDERMSETLENIYIRMEDYFRKSKPYLDSGLSVDAVARHLYTNKAYISKAVKLYSGLNFCQYVNRYRVSYSMSLFSSRPELHLIEMAQLSGFNSVTSLTISFRSFMNESAGDWCRRYRREQLEEKMK